MRKIVWLILFLLMGTQTTFAQQDIKELLDPKCQTPLCKQLQAQYREQVGDNGEPEFIIRKHAGENKQSDPSNKAENARPEIAASSQEWLDQQRGGQDMSGQMLDDQKKQIEEANRLLQKSAENNETEEKLLKRFEKILDRWEKQQDEYQRYLDSLKKSK